MIADHDPANYPDLDEEAILWTELEILESEMTDDGDPALGIAIAVIVSAAIYAVAVILAVTGNTDAIVWGVIATVLGIAAWVRWP
jgi:ABC-type uncharacterized transport system permease subunit